MNNRQVFPYREYLPKIAFDAFIAPTASIVGNVTIGALSNIWFGAVIRGDVNFVRIGERSNIQDNATVHVSGDQFSCTVGSDVTVGHGTILHGCTLQDNCFVGMGSTLLDGVVVESGAMVAAGALVTPGKVVKAGELWAGRPAKLFRPLTEEELASFATSAQHYADLGADYRVRLR